MDRRRVHRSDGPRRRGGMMDTRKRSTVFGRVALVASLVGGIAAGNISSQAAPPPDIVNAPYGPTQQNTLDLWKAKSARPTPLIVFVHGGAFVGPGELAIRELPILTWALEAGVSVAAVDYRLTRNGVVLPAPMQDAARAIQFLRSKAAEWNLDPRRVAAFGPSSGATISLWVAFHDDMANPSSTDPVERQSSRLRAVGSIWGQPSLDPRLARKIIGPPTETVQRLFRTIYGIADLDAPSAASLYEAASPVTYLSPDDPPVFAYYNRPRGAPPDTFDAYIHNPAMGTFLKERMDAIGVECVLRFSTDYQKQGEAQQETFQFLLRHLRD
jgi:hypothetical protein